MKNEILFPAFYSNIYHQMFIDFINTGLEELGYDGPNDYNAMYWFVKGRRQEKESQNRINEEQQRIKNHNIELLKQLQEHARKLKEFHHRHKK